ncbi:MAG: triphosphoribosyl-dephospho-CoA synthase [Gemmataceae bacterium]
MSVALWVQTACIWEACADKAGNVSRRHDFADTTLIDFLVSAAAIAPVLARTAQDGVGATVLEAVRATRLVCRANTNLGIVLLLTPLAVTADRAELSALLDRLTVADSRLVCAAIRAASPGGLGDAPEQDVADEPTLPLQKLMGLAAGRDRVARQYATGFAEVFDEVVPDLLERMPAGVEAAVRHAQLRQLARHGDSLIARKRGPAASDEARRRAAAALADPAARDSLDGWMLADGHARNPGTTADLIAAGLYVLLATGRLDVAAPWGADRIHDAPTT